MKPLLYDVYCGAGGCTKGYQRSGFYVIGIDINPQPRYCGDGFIQMNAFEFFRRYLRGEFPVASAFHASPPCQGYSKTAKLTKNSYPLLIESTREFLQKIGKPYVIENVPGAPLIQPIMLVGSMFGLCTMRHRLFECSFEMPFTLAPPPSAKTAKMGRKPRQGEYVHVVGHITDIDYCKAAMGITWMNRKELTEAIPPSYTEYIGNHLRQILI